VIGGPFGAGTYAIQICPCPCCFSILSFSFFPYISGMTVRAQVRTVNHRGHGVWIAPAAVVANASSLHTDNSFNPRHHIPRPLAPTAATFSTTLLSRARVCVIRFSARTLKIAEEDRRRGQINSTVRLDFSLQTGYVK